MSANSATLDGSVVASNAKKSEPRFFALDALRAVAMLLGVVYHSIGGGLGIGLKSSESGSFVMDWLHSFRMPLFFLISGFFCRMMYTKYGAQLYLKRRWSRLGAAMFVSLFAMTAFHYYMETGTEHSPVGAPAVVLNVAPIAPATTAIAALTPKHSPRIHPHQAKEKMSGIEDGRQLHKMMRPATPIADYFFGVEAHLFAFGPMWFIWYLLIFATTAPVVAILAQRGLSKVHPEKLQNISIKALRWGLVPLILALLSIPGRMQNNNSMDWSLGGAFGISSLFPDGLVQYQPDWAYFFVYFIAGWWHHRMRAELNQIARLWLPFFAVGSVVYFLAITFCQIYAPRITSPYYSLLSIIGYTLFSVSTAYTGYGLLGYFQKNFNQPSKVARFFADRAFWIYVLHMDLLGFLIWPRFAHLNLPFWVLTIGSTLISTGIACVTYELLVRRTFLNKIFGSGEKQIEKIPKKKASDSPTQLIRPALTS
ncbi:MAG: 2,3,4,5-tetrahydropyridine-2,6-carboxylate N-succinyltransferase [Verrucomicrobiales bacterium]|nr:2,3,4,5-tetrahydropyridine-2,6-carboxylate N-succinyltransferase [Verrucomicrobiales bacterium]